MADQVQIPAILTIDPETVRNLILAATRGMNIPSTASPPPPAQKNPESDYTPPPVLRRGRGRPKGSKTRKLEEVKFRISGSDSAELQAKSVIIQAAMHTHGDGKAREIMLAWGDEDTAAIATMKKIFPDVSLEAIGQAMMDAEDAEITGLPRVWMATIFTRANSYTKEAQGGEEEVEPEEEGEEEGIGPTACDICGSSGPTHKKGCPRALAEGDGGAIASRVGGPAQAAPAAQAEPCGLGGPPNCPLPHAVVLQGGAHIAVHTPEVVAKLRTALGGQQPEVRWNAPLPPNAKMVARAPQEAKPAKRRGGWPKGKKRGKKR